MKKLTLTSFVVLCVVCLSLAFTPGSALAGHQHHSDPWCGSYSYYPAYSYCYDSYVPYTPIYSYSYHYPHCYYRDRT